MSISIDIQTNRNNVAIAAEDCTEECADFSYVYSQLFLFTVVVTNYGTSTILCRQYSLPYDCEIDGQLFYTFERSTSMFVYIVLLYNFNHLDNLKNYGLWEKSFFMFISVGSNCLFSYISSIEELRSSFQLDKTKEMNEFNKYASYIYVSILIFQALLTTNNLARNGVNMRDIHLRIIIFTWYGIWCYLLYINDDKPIHLHHTFFSLLICILNYHDNFVTKILFFVSLGIFIQGIVNYKYEGLITQNTEPNSNTIYVDKIIYKCEYEYAAEFAYFDNLCEEVCL